MLKKYTSGLLLLCALALSHTAWANDNASRQPLTLYLVLHDDLSHHNTLELRQDYFAWLIKDLESFTDRYVRLAFIRDVPGLTDFAYQNDDVDETYYAWKNTMDRYVIDNDMERNATTKYLLLTQNKINSKTLGASEDKSYTGIASLETFAIPAHELGHMLGGTHEAAEVLYKGGWWCQTNIIESHEKIRSNCYVYSDANKQIMAEHLNRFP
ncbi:hypothetical protein JTE78_22965 [Pseudomonas syringae pv. aptata]|jgi:hypothetical protein|uniref:Reprolysin-like metallo-peptidase family M12B n=1 Tax=Pseudomonas syringae TaxID=317 RepID=A0AAQ1L9Z1_PSESX|nr:MULTISPECIES: hypothetical protein [Pseudomonas]KEZ70516.1 hypothetical protein C5I_0127305 [Pseudomonas syringae pv. syringae FF5]ELS44540.1 Hypothetical protein PSSB64_4928 [Pseudomonas syringae pv. syringae B64]KFF84747.1 hypothetical protein HM80_05275 [Pseudomonas syringae pv. syringae]KZL36127.1 hypothetical protein VT47_24275 [Pseudomonas syringae pv. syringae]MBI6740286.1 hypothetical protein [Pseudomonas syringae]